MSGDDVEQPLRLLLNFFDALSGCYLIVLDRNGAIQMVSHSFSDLIGVAANEMTGRPADELEAYLPGFKEQLAELQPQACRNFHIRLLDKQGKALFVEHTLVLLEEQGREFAVCIGHDLSRLSGGQESALHKAEQQLMAANRLKRKFIANINHAIRTPMNAIIGYAEMLAESSLDEQQQRYVTTIRKNSTALVSIINDVMELSKLETGSVRVLKSAANLKLVVEQATDLFTDQLRAKKLDFVCAIEPGLPEMYVMDADHCRQVLMNLISNAIKFTDRGRVSLDVTGVKTGPDLYDIAFRIADTGVGMTAEEQQSILELFAQQEEQISIHDGTRLGLTLCARLARMMGGGIRLESAPGEGSVFVFIMPVKAASPAPAALPQQQVSAAAEEPKQPVLLVVDDMPEMVNLVKIYFSNSRMQVLEASGPEDCLRLALAVRPDLILMDLDLAGADGRDVARQLKADSRTAQIPLAVMTGLMPEQHDSFMPPFDDFLAKPFHLQELQRLVDRYLNAPKKENAAPPPPSPDLTQLRAAWDSSLDAAYGQAQMSGSLDDALELGRKMEDSGLAAQSEELAAMGREMKKFAQELDIRGVEQILNALRNVAEAGS
jgi:PAS domain S-box-containing protein